MLFMIISLAHRWLQFDVRMTARTMYCHLASTFGFGTFNLQTVAADLQTLRFRIADKVNIARPSNIYIGRVRGLTFL